MTFAVMPFQLICARRQTRAKLRNTFIKEPVMSSSLFPGDPVLAINVQACSWSTA
jgi:hypothetical protein